MRRAGLRSRAPQLEHLPEQHQRDDHRRRLEVDGRPRRRARGTRAGTGPGNERRDHAVAVRDADAEPDQREHVEAAVARPTSTRAHEERPAAPEHDRRRERELRARRSHLGREPGGRSGSPGIISPIARTERRRGERHRAPRTAASCRRAPGSAPRRASPPRGSSAMPQIGQVAGPVAHDLRDASGRSTSFPAGPRRPTRRGAHRFACPPGTSPAAPRTCRLQPAEQK